MTAISNREPPDGYTEEWDSNAWSVGFVYRWSDVYEGWMDENVVVTVKPGKALCEAFEARMDHPMGSEYNIFFSKEG